MVANAIRFLQHEEVVDASDEDKRYFLLKKGLTGEEIAEAARRTGRTGGPRDAEFTGLSGGGFYGGSYAPEPKKGRSWWKNGLAVLGSLGAGAGAFGFVNKLMTDPIPEDPKLIRKRAEMEAK